MQFPCIPKLASLPRRSLPPRPEAIFQPSPYYHSAYYNHSYYSTNFSQQPNINFNPYYPYQSPYLHANPSNPPPPPPPPSQAQPPPQLSTHFKTMGLTLTQTSHSNNFASPEHPPRSYQHDSQYGHTPKFYMPYFYCDNPLG